jgi:cation diffusion facilitator CzcD-associated flavoprotein CzcO
MEQQVDALVIGAGPAGLAVAACLKKRGTSCMIVDRASEVGSSWRHHYDRLQLHSTGTVRPCLIFRFLLERHAIRRANR